MQIEDLRHRLQASGALPQHRDRVLRMWTRALPPDNGRHKPEHFLAAGAACRLHGAWASRRTTSTR
jgi:hypothetical protein